MPQETRVAVEGAGPPLLIDDPNLNSVLAVVGVPTENGPEPEWEPEEVSSSNYPQVLKRKRPVFRGTVPNRLSGREGEVLAVEVVLDAPTAQWPALLKERLPDLRDCGRLLDFLDALEREVIRRPQLAGQLGAVFAELAGALADANPDTPNEE